jgi:hypothetical protein
MGNATYAVLAGAAAGVLAFAVLATLSARKVEGKVARACRRVLRPVGEDPSKRRSSSALSSRGECLTKEQERVGTVQL